MSTPEAPCSVWASSLSRTGLPGARRGTKKIKVAAAQYPFRFIALKKSRESAGWQIEEF